MGNNHEKPISCDSSVAQVQRSSLVKRPCNGTSLCICCSQLGMPWGCPRQQWHETCWHTCGWGSWGVFKFMDITMSMVISLSTQFLGDLPNKHSPRTRCALLKGLFAGNYMVDYYTLDIESRPLILSWFIHGLFSSMHPTMTNYDPLIINRESWAKAKTPAKPVAAKAPRKLKRKQVPSRKPKRRPQKRRKSSRERDLRGNRKVKCFFETAQLLYYWLLEGT